MRTVRHSRYFRAWWAKGEVKETAGERKEDGFQCSEERGGRSRAG